MKFSRNSARPLTIFLLVAIGVVTAKAPSRIAGGVKASIFEFPWQAALYENNDFTCGGAIISERHVITAAHCVYSNEAITPSANISIVIGSDVLDIVKGEMHDVKSVSIHSGFEEIFPFPNDIAILKLANEIVIDRTKSPISLPTKDLPVEAIAIVSGWGLTYWRRQPKRLRKLELMIINNTECDELKIDDFIEYDYDSSMYDKPLISGQVCGLPAPNAGACEGDSGSALAHEGSLVGIVSWNYQCGQGYPNIFTRVYEYIDWIQETMSDIYST